MECPSCAQAEITGEVISASVIARTPAIILFNSLYRTMHIVSQLSAKTLG